ncbi:MAG: hypothetical protein R3C44_20580 [Chloroflexota bacterium]
MVLWPAREGTYVRESKDAVEATHRLVENTDSPGLRPGYESPR